MAEAKVDPSRKELADMYAKLKVRTKGAQEASKKQGEELIKDAITVGSGGLLGYYMGSMAGEAETDKDWAAADDEKQEEILAEYQQIAGLDIDLLVGGAAAAAGLLKMGGKMSDTVRAVGIGALTEWAGRTFYENGYDKAKETEEEEG